MQRRGLPRIAASCAARVTFLAAFTRAFAFFFVSSAHAAEPVPIRLDYTAPPSCPAAAQFLDEVAARTSLARAAKPNEQATSLTISIQEVPGGEKGTLRLAAPDKPSSAREVSASDCDQVVSALALMTALAIDPDASTEPVRTLPKPPPPAPRAAPPPPAPPRSPPEKPPTPHRRWRFELGADVEALGGVAPELVLFVRPFVELSNPGATWSSALRVSGGFGRGAVRLDPGGGEFTLLAGRAEGCPARYQALRSLRISPCIALDVGRLSASGAFVTPAQHVNRPWVAPGAVGRLEWEIVHVLVIEVAGEILLPAVRDRFFVASDTTLHRTPAMAGGVGAGIGVLFP